MRLTRIIRPDDRRCGGGGWLSILLLVLLCSNCYSTSSQMQMQKQQQQKQQQQQNNPYFSMHAGVERDFQNLLLEQERHQGLQPSFPNRLLQNELSFCYDALYLADTNQDFKVDNDEFVTFAQIMGPPGFLPRVDRYQELPLILQSNFIILTCLCLQMPTFDGGDSIDPQCCSVDPHIDVNGTHPGQVPTYEQEQYLYQVCFLTETSIERLIISQTPSGAPTLTPSIVVVTTDKPSKTPTERPTSRKPTRTPTDRPSRRPTRKPTNAPTDTPTGEPSYEPTDKPTNEPTTEKPSNKPTGKPSYKPTEKPTDEPSTGMPSNEPTDNPTTNEPSSKPVDELTDEPSSEEPTGKPTEEVDVTSKPTNNPTLKPTNFFPLPTGTQTEKPTNEPTYKPTDKPTTPEAPTTSEPTREPNEEPTVEPTSESPTVVNGTTPDPTVKDDDVTSIPIVAPSDVPSSVPMTTLNPTDASTNVDTSISMEVATVNYGIAIAEGKLQDVPSSYYDPDLVDSMNILAQQVADSMNADTNDVAETTNRIRSLRRHVVNQRSSSSSRRLVATIVMVNLPTTIDGNIVTNCPSFVSLNDECETVTASIQLNIVTNDPTPTTRRQLQDNSQSNDVDPIAVKDSFQSALNTAIENGQLQVALDEINPDSIVSVTTGAILPPPPPTPISPAGIAGIVLAGLGGMIIGFLIIGAARRRGLESAGGNLDGGSSADGEFMQDVEEAEIKRAGVLQGAVVTSIVEDDAYATGAGKFQTPSSTRAEPAQSPDLAVDTTSAAGIGALGAVAVVGTAAAIAATSSSSENDNDGSQKSLPPTSSTKGSSSPGKKKRPSNALYEVPGAKGMASDDASSAGESGWSSNQDGSSVDNSLDSIPSVALASAGTAIAAAGMHNEETVDETSSLVASPIRNRSSAEQEQTSTASQSLSPMNSLSPLNSLSPTQSQGSGSASRHSPGHSYAGTEDSIHSTYSELDDAIQKGDWAAVGVTAALLASQAYVDDSTQGSSKQSGSILRKQKSTLNPERAAELDLLVEAGDWEGVVAAAAKFDAQEALRGDAQSSQNSESGSVVSSAAGSNTSSGVSGSVGGSSTGTAPSNLSGSHTIDTTTSPSTYTATGLTATSDTASTRSKARKLNEIRDEVEALVVAVVPEEADNVDEMMTQFRGREEELVETLRSMQERQVAQKARKESQKQAKRQAKAYVEDKKSNQEAFGAVDNTGHPADDMWMEEIENSESTALDDAAAAATRGLALETPMEVDEEEEAKAMKAQLKEAINNEDWENVAEAAAGLSGHAYGQEESDDTKEQNTDSESITSSTRSLEINTLVDKGDWDGVVAAASRYAEVGTNESSTLDDTEGEIVDDSTIEERRKRREERLKEEEEALEQAEIWGAIADQTKVEDKGKEEGASLAADWAIDQSLAALQKAEEDNDQDSADTDKERNKDDGDGESL
ncbi:MAG: hypothetical protein ACI8RD_005869 [Bacillariaceae sp.]|jgi:hypothetical protein